MVFLGFNGITLPCGSIILPWLRKGIRKLTDVNSLFKNLMVSPGVD